MSNHLQTSIKYLKTTSRTFLTENIRFPIFSFGLKIRAKQNKKAFESNRTSLLLLFSFKCEHSPFIRRIVNSCVDCKIKSIRSIVLRKKKQDNNFSNNQQIRGPTR